MYLKLLFTADKGLEPLLRILAYVINTSSITSAATLNTALTNTGIFAADIGNGFDSTNSEIIRTVNLSTTTAHIAKTAVANTLYFTLQQAVYDSPTTYYYTQLQMVAANSATTSLQGDGLTGGTMASSQLDQTQAATTATAGGTILGLTNTSVDYAAGFNTPTVSNWRALHCYITDKTFWWAYSTVGGATGVGWSGTYTTLNTVSGLFVSQYTRQDHWNIATNGIIPVAATRMTASYNGLFNASSSYANVTTLVDGSTAAYYTQIQPLKVLNMINIACNSTTGTYTKDYHRIVSHNLGGFRSSSNYALSAAVSTATTGQSGYSSYGPVIVNTISYKLPNATNTQASFALFPLTWSNTFYGAYGGGNITEQSGVWIFYGDYAAGDDFSYNSKTYTLWPSGTNPTSTRLGFAIPKE